MKTIRRIHGFTLIEILLVLAIVGMILYATTGYILQKSQQMRIDKTTLEMQQILNAGLSYYVSNGNWPADISTLQTAGYLPTGTLNNPWAQPYYVLPSTPGSAPSNFYVYTSIPAGGAYTAPAATPPATGTPNTSNTAAVTAQIIAGTLPFGFVTNQPAPLAAPPAPSACTVGTPCVVAAYVNIPGYNLNNASAVNFAGLYKHGACVPVPNCPIDNKGNPMQPQIMVIPVSVSGVYDSNGTNLYPLSSFTAYATGDPSTNGINPPACIPPVTPPACSSQYGSPYAYWRVCLQVITERGDVATFNKTYGQYVTLLAITRCASINEPSGSNFSIFETD